MMSKFREKFIRQHFIRIKLLLILALAFQITLFGQEKQVKGTVTDATGNPLPGVNVVVKGTMTGIVTDINGNYSIAVSPEDILVFSFIGYLAEEYPVGTNSVIDVTLEEDIIGLDEIVVVGYGTQKKKLNTGANLNISGEDIQAMNTIGSMDALKGLSPGVSITQNNGVPGSGNKIYIRGIGTTGNSDPLYIVDGIAVGDIDNLSPSDIESIDILKDAASAAIYGSRGANGVVLVTTRKGRRDTKPVVTYSHYIGWQNVAKRPELLNAQEYANAVNESSISAGMDSFNFASQVPDWDRIESGEWEGTKWFEEIEDKNAPVKNITLNITGGSERSVYSIGASLLEQQGILGKQINNDYKRINLRLNSEHILIRTKSGRDILTFGENLTYTREKNPTIRTGNIYWSDLHNMMVSSPFLPMYTDDPDDLAYPYHYAIPWNTQESNPVADMINHGKWNTNNNNTIIGNAYLELQPIKNLKLRSSFGINNWYGHSRHWTPEYHLSTVNNGDYDQVDQSMNSGFTWTLTNTITYSFNIVNAHNFTVLAGHEAIKNESTLTMDGHNESSIFNDPEYGYLDNFPELDASNVGLANFGGKDEYGWAMVSYFGRLSYDFKERYLFTAVLRYDGSSNFDRGHRWGTFPSFSVGWVISNEPFMSPLSSWLSFLKLRASWGQNGNQDIDRDFVYLSTIDIEGVNYFFGTDHSLITTGSAPAQVPNPLISWETSEQTNIGWDMNYLNNRLQFSLDLYRKDTKDWLVEKISSVMDGTEPPWVNGGLIRNQGIETMLRWNDQKGGFRYDISATFAYNHNEVIEVPSEDSIFHGPSNVLSQGTGEMFRAEAGYPIGYFWGLETDGVLQNQEDVDNWVGPTGRPYFTTRVGPGDLRFVDQNNDGQINDNDRVMLGSPHPKFIFGLQINLEFKGVYLQISGNGQAGHQVAKNYRSIDNYRHNFTKEVYDQRWHGEGTSDTYPRLYRGGHRNYQLISDIYIYDADFFRISNVTLGYNFKELSKRIPMDEIRFYISAKNLHTFTKYPGMDPEVGYSPDDYEWGSGIDLGLYPQSKTFLLGFILTF
ncbi:MAG: TonB-dependent receptor [Bacteroidales bacterium]|nr:TonB-dependent receptor [Bacteroidales bacterium]